MSTGQSPQVKMTREQVAETATERRLRDSREREERKVNERSRSRARRLLGR